MNLDINETTSDYERKYTSAFYKDAELPEHKGNPLIEALPSPLSRGEMMEFFAYYPELDCEIRNNGSVELRRYYTLRLKTLRQPVHDYMRCFEFIDRTLRDGYSSRNPLTASMRMHVAYPSNAQPGVVPKGGYYKPKADTVTVIGDSGVGKTSMLEQVLNYFPEIIVHKQYKGSFVDFTKQIVWIKVDCPFNSTTRELCEKIIRKIDLCIGIEDTVYSRSIGGLVRQIEQKIKSTFLGILVIDEMQYLKPAKTQGLNNLLNFLHYIVNELGIPLLFCGNPEFEVRISNSLRSARRAEGGGYMKMEHLKKDSDDWHAFIEELWDLQWTNIKTEISEALKEKMYSLTHGNMDLTQRTYCQAQLIVIGSGNEEINENVIEVAFFQACHLSRQSPEYYDNSIEYTLPVRRKSTSIVLDKNSNKGSNKFLVKGDVNRSCHDEFSDRVYETMDDFSLKNHELSTIRNAVQRNDVQGYLDISGLLFNPVASDFY